MTQPQDHDCLIVGAGPAGLSAALYMARFMRRTAVLHDGTARALRIPKTHNAPGFNEGVSGIELIERMSCHAERYGAALVEARIASAQHGADGVFTLAAEDGRTWRGRTVILATGILLNQIDLPEPVHEAAIRADVLRYCPVCDGFEHRGKAIAVIGCDSQGAGEALFLRRYTERLTLIPRSYADLDPAEHAKLINAGIAVIESPAESYSPASDGMTVHFGDGTHQQFDVVYPALGVTPRTELAAQLGLPLDDCGCTEPDSVFSTDVPGLWCAGDIVEGLDQISVALGHGAIAATKAHNWLREQDGDTLD